ncbi:hypothetical protein ACFV3E_35535 [Streptomyces sp. NPDC059718]
MAPLLPTIAALPDAHAEGLWNRAERNGTPEEEEETSSTSPGRRDSSTP